MYTRVNQNPQICGVKIYFDGGFQLLRFLENGPKDKKRYYETKPTGIVKAEKVYLGRGSFRFQENPQTSEAGTSYKQTASFRFPSNDPMRGQRIDSFQKVKYLEMMLSNGDSLILGRNDIFQNRKPNVLVSSDLQMTEVKIESESIQPVLRVHKSNDDVNTSGYDYTYDFELSWVERLYLCR